MGYLLEGFGILYLAQIRGFMFITEQFLQGNVPYFKALTK